MGIEQFSNTAKLEHILGEKRNRRVLEEIVFTDLNGTKWIAPKDSIVNGASIPRVFWPLIGSPFVGLYVRASVLHDVYCQTKSKPHKSVHKMFRDAMLADGMSSLKAKAMFKAVWSFGPRWKS